MKTREQLIAEREAIDAQLAEMDKPKWVPPTVSYNYDKYDGYLAMKIWLDETMTDGLALRDYMSKCAFAWSAKEFVCPGPGPGWKNGVITKYVPHINFNTKLPGATDHWHVQELPVCAGTREDAEKIAALLLPYYIDQEDK